MGDWVCIRIAPDGNETPITPSNIYFLDNGFHPLATSQKVCDAWLERSEAKDRRLFARRWSTPGSSLALVRKNWPPSSNITSRSWPVSRVANVGLMSLNSLFCPEPSALTRLNYWRSSKLPRNPTTGFEHEDASGNRESNSHGVTIVPLRSSKRPKESKPSVW